MGRPVAARIARRGFTLLEALVTLVLVALIATLLMQSLLHAMTVRERLLSVQAHARVAALQELWVREALAGALPDLSSGYGVFVGTPERIEFVTSAPLSGETLSRATLSLERAGTGAHLDYSDAGMDSIRVIEHPLRAASFAYADATGAWHGSWPPTGRNPEHLPRAVRLEAEGHRGRVDWLVAILPSPRPPVDLRPPELDVGR